MTTLAGGNIRSVDLRARARATLIVTDGDLLEIPTHVEMAFIDGAKIDLRSRHTELYDKYRQRYGK